MTRALYSMSLTGRTVVERRFGLGLGLHNTETLGEIKKAAYLGATPVAFWTRLFGGTGGGVLLPPFDAAGADVHELYREPYPLLDGDDDPFGSVRLAHGTVTALSPRQAGDDVVVRDAWSVERGVRVTSAIHFGLVIEGTRLPPVAVAFAQSPLVVAKPRLATLEAALIDVPAEAGAALVRSWPDIALSQPASVVELRVGDTLDVLGMVTTKEQCHGRFDLEGRTANYRETASDLSLVVGDRLGLRMVLRKL